MLNKKKSSDAERVQCVSDGRRTFLKMGAIGLAMLGLNAASADPALAANNNRWWSLFVAPQQTGAVDLGAGDVGVMNYAFALEQAELAFLRQVIANPYKGMPANERQVFQDLHDQEVVHNEFFASMLGARAIPKLQTDFSRVKFNDRDSVLTTAMTFADLATSAYNGAGKLLVDPANLEISGKIVSVEARHASAVRDLIKPNSGFFAPEALDPAREPAEVLKIASLFVKTPLNASRLPKS